jgi:hypothetical protein
MAPDLLVLAAYFTLFFLVAILAALENRQMIHGNQTISSFLHEHVFAVVMLGGWILVGIGMLVGHFVSGPIYCGTP